MNPPPSHAVSEGRHFWKVSLRSSAPPPPNEVREMRQKTGPHFASLAKVGLYFALKKEPRDWTALNPN